MFCSLSFSEGRPNRGDLSVLVEHNDDPSGNDQCWRFRQKVEEQRINTFSINQLVDYYKSCLLIGWATHCIPLVAKGIYFQIENNDRKLTCWRGFGSVL